jgi:hypothetical protein
MSNFFTEQYVEKAKEAVANVIYSIESSCETFDVTKDDIAKVLEKFMLDMFIPSLKDGYLNSLQFALWGEDVSVKSTISAKRRDYNSINRKTNLKEYKEDFGSENLDKLIFSTKDEAELIVTKLDDYVSQYGYVTVGYLFELMGEFCPYTAEYYGWRDLDRAYVKRVRDGCQLILPRPVRIES